MLPRGARPEGQADHTQATILEPQEEGGVDAPKPRDPGLWSLALAICFQPRSVSGSVVSDSLQPYGLQPARLLCPWSSPGKNTGVSCHALLQRIFLTQVSEPRFLSPELAGIFFTTSTTWEAQY